jgi:hypothetical protein
VGLPPAFAATRESLRALACYAISPARKARTGRIGLRPTGDGFGTPPFDDGSRITVRGDRLRIEPGGPETAVTTVRAAAGFLHVDLSPDPGVGHDLPPFEPDRDLAVDASASLALGAWYALGQGVLDELVTVSDGRVSEAQLWPEHFDLAVVVDLDEGVGVNVGFSAGDTFHDAPYVYVGPHDVARLDGRFWNAPFGAYLGHADLEASGDAHGQARAFVAEGLRLVRSLG